jgi:hypothetical protein
MSMDILNKLLTVHRTDARLVCVIRALGEIPVIRYAEEHTRDGHTITLTFPAELVEVYLPVDAGTR